MTPVTVQTLEVLAPHTPAARLELFVPHINAAMERFEIVTPERQAAFLPQMAVETAGFKTLVENLYYTHADRIALIFRAHYDKNKDGEISAEELAFAQGFVGQPEKLANYVYANRNGNGPVESGDGWKYRGRGGFDTTGRANYMATSIGLFNDQNVLLAHPEMLEQPEHACASAGWYWHRHGCNELADEGNFRQITREINGGFTGYKERSDLWDEMKRVLV